ncbi:MAG: exodeoxyribonuclease III [Acidobacteriota bacterium]|nr:exodeoxyribonuclease III [Acidobacteriota bacterium]
MRIATWNINGLNARLDFLLHWLDARKPDVVGLQELKLEDDKFPHRELQAAGYHALAHGQKAWNGVAVLSREPGEVVERGLPGQEDFGARLVTARVGGLTFTTIYCPNGKSVGHEDFPRKLAWYDSLTAHVSGHVREGEPFVLCGDFNVCPEAVDSWHQEDPTGRIFHTAEERRRFGKLLDLGLYDLFRFRYPQEQKFSWWDYRAGSFHKNLGLRIDFLLATDAVRKRLQDVEIDREYRKKKDGLIASDHAPVMAELA